MRGCLADGTGCGGGGTAVTSMRPIWICISFGSRSGTVGRAAKFFGVVPGGSGSGSGSGSGGSPYISIVSPTDGEDVSGSVAVVVAAGDDAGIAHVDLTIDGGLFGSDNTAPYQFTWTATGTGSHTLVATATDVNGGTATTMATVTVASGSGAGSGAGETGGGNGLPACSLNAGGASGGLAPIGIAILAIFRRRRR